MNEYPNDWKEIATRIKDAAEWECERCEWPHDPPTAHTLTVHHLDGDKANCEDWNLAALCQRCHLSIQGRVNWSQGYFLDHSPWMQKHVDAYREEMAETEESAT